MNRLERLSALDSSFVFMESPTAPSHGGFISIMDGPIDFEAFRDGLATKLPRLKRFRQRIQRVPFNIAYPAWVTASDFDIKDHVHHIQFDTPVPESRAYEALLDIFHKGLDHSKPLWSFHIINGIEGDRAAIVHIMHHCVVDGGSAAIIAKALYDIGPVEYKEAACDEEEMPPAPNALEAFIHAIFENAVNGMAVALRSPKAILTTLRAVRTPAFREGFAEMREYDRAPGLRFPFDGPPSGKVDFATASLPFNEMRQLGAKYGGTINDVLLAIVTGGVRRYAQDCDLDVTGKSFKFQMPTNVRMPDQDGKMGNFAAPAPVHVPLDIEDPIERLQAVIARTSRIKRLKVAMGLHYAIQTIQTLMTPPGLILSLSLYGNRRLRLLEKARNRPPGTNMFVTNLPRPQLPLYIAGRKILKRHVLVPLLPNHRMVCGAITYDQNLEISFTGDVTVEPGVAAMMRYTIDAYEQLAGASDRGATSRTPSHEEPKPAAGFG